jgi:hypothetical protein
MADSRLVRGTQHCGNGHHLATCAAVFRKLSSSHRAAIPAAVHAQSSHRPTPIVPRSQCRSSHCLNPCHDPCSVLPSCRNPCRDPCSVLPVPRSMLSPTVVLSHSHHRPSHLQVLLLPVFRKLSGSHRAAIPAAVHAQSPPRPTPNRPTISLFPLPPSLSRSMRSAATVPFIPVTVHAQSSHRPTIPMSVFTLPPSLSRSMSMLPPCRHPCRDPCSVLPIVPRSSRLSPTTRRGALSMERDREWRQRGRPTWDRGTMGVGRWGGLRHELRQELRPDGSWIVFRNTGGRTWEVRPHRAAIRAQSYHRPFPIAVIDLLTSKFSQFSETIQRSRQPCALMYLY